MTLLTPFSERQALSIMPESSCIFELSQLALMAVIGEQAQNFLQGQFTADLREVCAQQMRSSALCNVQGRIICLTDLIFYQGFKLLMPVDLLAIMQNSLERVAALAKIQWEFLGERYKIYGFYRHPTDRDCFPLGFRDNLASNELVSLGEQEGFFYSLGDNFYIFALAASQIGDFIGDFIRSGRIGSSQDWDFLRLLCKYPRIHPESSGLFLPHHLELHSKNYISFTKGCYRGQEIIARMQYRAKLKYALKLYTAQLNESEVEQFIGREVSRTEKDESVGELVDYCQVVENLYLFAASVYSDLDGPILLKNKN